MRHRGKGTRFIPTHVGNGWSRRTAQAGGAVHPHACGERPNSFRRILASSGSSPRMWGTDPSGAHKGLGARFIPTHVGNGEKIRQILPIKPVHPHACGERRRWLDRVSGGVGSSPRMWGTASCLLAHLAKRRFIPTHVGNGPATENQRKKIAVHPHACGERFVISEVYALVPGSSPRMWGTVVAVQVAQRFRRFIPTHVGNGLAPLATTRTSPVHPHACGERWRGHGGQRTPGGSSPRMWGTGRTLCQSI